MRQRGVNKAIYTCTCTLAIPWLEVDTHAFRLEYIGTPVGSERSSDAENTQVVGAAHSVAA